MGLPEVMHADSFDWLREYAGEPFDAIVTDPPYGLKFMGKAWDDFGTPLGYQRWSQAWAELALELVKPGAHMVAFGAPRLYHRMAVGVEDAGWEIRDSLMWLYGSGFPKSLNLAGEDASNGVESGGGQCRCGDYDPHTDSSGLGKPATGSRTSCSNCGKNAPSPTSNGYGTALKPAYEPIILARKPLSSTVQETFDAHGTGALHIDAARIPLNGPAGWTDGDTRTPADGSSFEGSLDSSWIGIKRPPHDAGRWPANVVLDEDAAAMLDAEAGLRRTPTPLSASDEKQGPETVYGDGLSRYQTAAAEVMQSIRVSVEADATGPSRFFYTSKASRTEREVGLSGNGQRRSDGRDTESDHPRLRTTTRRNHHPSVKPIDLMRWLCRLVVPAGGRILDPFAGSGSTLIAAHQEGMTVVGLERDPEYVDIARGRIAHHCAQQMLL